MTTFEIEARDPLVLRDGRPNDGRSESRTMPFPAPSTVAGVVRTALGRRHGRFDAGLRDALLRDVAIRGPLLVGDDGLYVPAPRDALLVDGGRGAEAVPLVPLVLPLGAATSNIGEGLALVGIEAEASTRAKPVAETPAFWRWASLEAWLHDPRARNAEETRALLIGGLAALSREERVHVAIGASGTAEDGKLFATEGLRLAATAFGSPSDAEAVAVRLLVDVAVTSNELGELSAGMRPLGGERRLTRWETSRRALPAIPGWLADHVAAGDGATVRVVLLTPAYFDLSTAAAALARAAVARVVAAKVDRPRTISGWDMAARPPHGWPKRTRRLAEAGSVFWVELSGPAAERRRWLEDVWMRNVGDHPQLCRDGFGLAAVGIGGAR